MYQCIGRRKEGRDYIRCENTSETPSVPDKPHLGYLCSACANAPASGSVRNSKGIVEERPE